MKIPTFIKEKRKNIIVLMLIGITMLYGAAMGYAWAAHGSASDEQKFATLCNYEKGEVQGEVCIVEDRVYKITIPEEGQ